MNVLAKVLKKIAFGSIVDDSATVDKIDLHELTLPEWYPEKDSNIFVTLSIEKEPSGWKTTVLLVMVLFIALVFYHHRVVQPMLDRRVAEILEIHNLNPNPSCASWPVARQEPNITIANNTAAPIPVAYATLLSPQEVLQDEAYAEVLHVYNNSDHEEDNIPFVYPTFLSNEERPDRRDMRIRFRASR